MNKVGYVYILANKKDGVLYVGVTNNLSRRIYEHREGLVDGFTKKYCVKNLVYYEECADMESAILREKQLKGGNRKKKIISIENINKDWKDLYEEII